MLALFSPPVIIIKIRKKVRKNTHLISILSPCVFVKPLFFKFFVILNFIWVWSPVSPCHWRDSTGSFLNCGKSNQFLPLRSRENEEHRLTGISRTPWPTGIKFHFRTKWYHCNPPQNQRRKSWFLSDYKSPSGTVFFSFRCGEKFRLYCRSQKLSEGISDGCTFSVGRSGGTFFGSGLLCLEGNETAQADHTEKGASEY